MRFPPTGGMRIAPEAVMQQHHLLGIAVLACCLPSCGTAYAPVLAPFGVVGEDAAPTSPTSATSSIPPAAASGESATSRRGGPWEITLGGAGTSNDVWDAGGAQAAGSLGYYFSEWVELSVRQNGSYSDAGDGQAEVWNGTSRLALDVHIPFGGFVPYVGANLGYAYGDSVHDSLMAGPELGAKIYVKDDVFVLLAAEYQFFFDRADSLDTAFDEGQFVYGLSLGFRF